jgi:putative nucleotidyltransferase with HDIG domain
LRIEAPQLGTNGRENRITLLGDTQAAFGRLRQRLEGDGEVLVAFYATGLGLGAVAVASALFSSGWSVPTPWVVLSLGLVAAIAERGRVKLPSHVDVSISLLPTLFVAVVFGPPAAMLVGAISFIGEFKPPYLRWIVFTSSRALTWASAGLVGELVRGLSDSQVGSLVIAATSGALVSQALDTANAAVTFRLRGKGRMREVFSSLAPLAVASVPFFASVVVLLALAFEALSPWTLALFFVPVLGAQRLFVLYQEQRQLAEDFGVVNRRLERANLSFATALVATLDARDRYTAGHSAAVAIYARDIAKRLGLPDGEQQLAHLCGLVHDIGKVGLAPGLLEKPGALTLAERRHMQEHSAIGEHILRKVEDYAEIAHIVRHHHERWDGEGYPDGRSGPEIPLLARVIAVADAYDAMTSDRPYRDAMPSRVARIRLAQAVESQFDTTVVAAFEAVLVGASDDYRCGSRKDFSLEAQDPWRSLVVETRVA